MHAEVGGRSLRTRGRHCKSARSVWDTMGYYTRSLGTNRMPCVAVYGDYGEVLFSCVCPPACLSVNMSAKNYWLENWKQ